MASTATDACSDDGGASSDDDACGFSLRAPGGAKNLFGDAMGGAGSAAPPPPPASNENPFAPKDLSRCDSRASVEAFDRQASGRAAPPAPVRGGRSRGGSGDADGVESRFRHDFEIVKVIGSGTFGTVHKVKSRLDGCLYAVKSSKARFKGALHRDRMLKEVFALAALATRAGDNSAGLAHCVRYQSAWIEDERLFIQTELCDSSLESRAARGRFPPTPDNMWGLVRQMLLALDLLHSNGLVHLDLKPGNIFVSGERHFKLGDFGLATRSKGNSSGDVVEGDSRYMSRELLDDDDFGDPRDVADRDLTKADLFSLGATAFELIKRQPLAPNGPGWHALRDGSVAFPPTLPRELRDAVAALLHPNPVFRPAAAQMLASVPSLKSEVDKMASALAAEKQHVAQYRDDVVRLSKQRLARSNTWA